MSTLSGLSAAHEVVVRVSAEASPNSNTSFPSAYGRARVTVDGVELTAPRWTSFGASEEAALYNAKNVDRLKGGGTMEAICRAMAEAVTGGM